MNFQRLSRVYSVVAVITILTAFVDRDISSSDPKINLPYKKMGLTKEQAAAHLLSRFSFGAKPGQIKEVVEMGLEKWVQQQPGKNQSAFKSDVQGGKVYNNIKTLEKNKLEDGRDLPVSTDFRSVFSAVANKHLQINDNGKLFPGWEGRGLGLMK